MFGEESDRHVIVTLGSFTFAVLAARLPYAAYRRTWRTTRNAMLRWTGSGNFLRHY